VIYLDDRNAHQSQLHMSKIHFNWKFNLSIKVVLLSLILSISHDSNGQEDCNCKSAEKITVCYYSTLKFCPPGPECRYTLDGTFMNSSLKAKLQNTALFGPQGISKCPIVLEAVEDVNTVEYLEQKECNIMFIGVFSTIQNGSFIPSSIPLSDLATIKEWSTKCSSNLTIVSQIEAAPWGYEFKDLNVNPNKPDPDFTDFSIFDGSFGKISLFNQGGSFQGIFTDFPTTGYSILARDNNNEPTIVLDSLTNDIILGDIGVLCTIAGPMSASPFILNDSDILACNLFDLGCKIASNSTTHFISICEGENYVTAGGQIISDDGVYLDSLLNIEGCDSLIYTLLAVNSLYDTVFTQRLCGQEDYVISVGTNIYSKTNTFGTEFLESNAGCDSNVHIELYYFQTDTTYLFETICKNDTFFVNGIPFMETAFTIIPLQNEDLCDSLVYLDLVSQDSYQTQLNIDLCPEEVYIASDGTVLSEDGLYTEFHLSEKLCDSFNTLFIKVNEIYQEEESYVGCKDDGYSLTIGGNIYNEFNTSGIEYLQSSKGCDSTVNVSFLYQSLDTTYLHVQLCPYESFEVGGVEYSGNTYESIALPSSKNCDSIVLLDLETFESEEIAIENSYDVNLNSPFTFDLPEVASSTYEWTSDGELSCNFCANPNLLLNNLPSFLQLDYTDEFNCFYSSSATITYRCTPFFSNVINTNSATEENQSFKLKALCSFDNYSMNIFDRWGALVFASNDEEESWDGWSNGKFVEQGVYIFLMTYTLKGQQLQMVGSLTVLH